MSTITAVAAPTLPQSRPDPAAASRIEAEIAHDVFEQTHPDEQGLHLRPNSQGLFLQAKGDAKGTVLMFHGYTGGAWQYPEMAKKFNDAGYNVYAPRMPGHGFADANEVPSGKEIPDFHNREGWAAFVDHTYQEAADLGAPVSALGLSGGGNVALRLGERHSDVKKVVAMSPYLGPALPSDGIKGLEFPALRLADKLSFGVVGKVLDHLPVGKNTRSDNDPTPHTQGSLGQALLMNEVGYNVKEIAGDLQLITTDGDMLSGQYNDKKLFERNSDAEHHNGWYHFHRDEHVPHALLSPLENKVDGSVATVQDIAFNFIDKAQATQRA